MSSIGNCVHWSLVSLMGERSFVQRFWVSLRNPLLANGMLRKLRKKMFGEKRERPLASWVSLRGVQQVYVRLHKMGTHQQEWTVICEASPQYKITNILHYVIYNTSSFTGLLLLHSSNWQSDDANGYLSSLPLKVVLPERWKRLEPSGKPKEWFLLPSSLHFSLEKNLRKMVMMMVIITSIYPARNQVLIHYPFSIKQGTIYKLQILSGMMLSEEWERPPPLWDI